MFHPPFQGAVENRGEAAGRLNRKCNGNSVNSCPHGHASQTAGNNRLYEKLGVWIAGGIFWFILYLRVTPRYQMRAFVCRLIRALYSELSHFTGDDSVDTSEC